MKAVQSEVASIENTIAGFAEKFTSKHLTATDELCVGSTCVTPAQFEALVAAANQSSGAPSSRSVSTATDTPPVIQINGADPAVIQVGATYNDLGATITGPRADLNLGIQTYLNGDMMSPIAIDTSAAATDTIAYLVTDQNGLRSTSTRVVIVVAASDTATSPPLTSSTLSHPLIFSDAKLRPEIGLSSGESRMTSPEVRLRASRFSRRMSGNAKSGAFGYPFHPRWRPKAAEIRPLPK